MELGLLRLAESSLNVSSSIGPWPGDTVREEAAAWVPVADVIGPRHRLTESPRLVAQWTAAADRGVISQAARAIEVDRPTVTVPD